MILNSYYLNEYVPKYYVADHEILEKFKRIRENIWNFKDGGNEGQKYFIDDVVSIIQEIKSLNENERIIIIPIPASNTYSTYKRFYNFLGEVCNKTGIINGYGAIESEDHEPNHRGGPRTHNFSKNSSFQILENDIIIIFDDIRTSGRSFMKASDLFITNRVHGLFLGKTIDRLNKHNYIKSHLTMEDFL
ncbi:hypothetical protein [Fusobacterium ulcerans]|uniref:hypothetical protein n=1 Tax=Fusobacterium ulcerans TaxID=861 RepID=UPI0027B9A127|nr:hypothetical protein [Fusobacterium ulcerans]